MRGRIENAVNLYLIRQSANNDYDTYDSAIVCARDEDDARSIHPGGYDEVVPLGDSQRDPSGTWTSHNNVKVKLVGVAVEGIERGVLVASSNAGG